VEPSDSLMFVLANQWFNKKTLTPERKN